MRAKHGLRSTTRRNRLQVGKLFLRKERKKDRKKDYFTF